jgi:hypothetical protein
VGGGNLASLRTLRLLKVLRAFRLVRRAKRLRNMVLALASSVPSILSTISFICLFLFTVAVLGTQFFSGVREGYGIHQHNNFRTVWKGLQLLLRVITGNICIYICIWRKMMIDRSISLLYLSETELIQVARLTHLFHQERIGRSQCVIVPLNRLSAPQMSRFDERNIFLL